VPGENRGYHVGREREAGAPAKRVVALLPEGVLNQRRTSKARVSGEAPAALLPEGVLNPINGTSAATHVALPRHALWGVMTWVPGENRRYHVGRERGGSGSFAAGGGAEPR